MIHVLNSLPKDCDVILDGLENFLMVTKDNVLTIDVIDKNFNHRYKKIKNKEEEKVKKEKSL